MRRQYAKAQQAGERREKSRPDRMQMNHVRMQEEPRI